MEETINILRGLKNKYELHHRVKISSEAITACATLSDRYITERSLPDKAIDVMDETGARIKLKRYTIPPELKEIEKDFKRLNKEKNLYAKLHDFVKSASIKNEEERIKKLYNDLYKTWRENQQKDIQEIKGLVTRQHVLG